MSGKDSNKVRIVGISPLPIPLYKLLKFDSMVQSGGEAKFVIGEGLVSVNGEVETRKSKKIFPGDVISFEDETIQVVLRDEK